MYVDLTGRRFERLLVIARMENNRFGTAMWLCECDCGELWATASEQAYNRRKPRRAKTQKFLR